MIDCSGSVVHTVVHNIIMEYQDIFKESVHPLLDFGGKQFKIEIDSSILAGRNSK